jgi:hypothetical protein
VNAESRWSRLLPQFQLADPGLAALRTAARAAIVMPLVFAFADKVIGDPQTALFAAFGSFAMLVFVDFTGPRRSQFFAYLALAVAGAANVALGTLCSRNTWLAVAAVAVIGFAILLSGAINGYFAAASTSALLTFVLPVTISAPLSEIPARLEGWALAAAAGICAHMLLWPARPHDTVRADAARACVDLGDRRFDVMFAVRVGLFHREPEEAHALAERWLARGGKVRAFFDPASQTS